MLALEAIISNKLPQDQIVSADAGFDDSWKVGIIAELADKLAVKKHEKETPAWG